MYVICLLMRLVIFFVSEEQTEVTAKACNPNRLRPAQPQPKPHPQPKPETPQPGNLRRLHPRLRDPRIPRSDSSRNAFFARKRLSNSARLNQMKSGKI